MNLTKSELNQGRNTTPKTSREKVQKKKNPNLLLSKSNSKINESIINVSIGESIKSGTKSYKFKQRSPISINLKTNIINKINRM
jgi:hypothetical protein